MIRRRLRRGGYYTAKVGGLWDVLLGEGRRWFNYRQFRLSPALHVQCDGGAATTSTPASIRRPGCMRSIQDGDGDYSLNEIADGLRSGNAYFVHGDLINHLEFEAQNTQ